MEISSETLISLVEGRVVLWDKTLDSYKNKNLRIEAWNEICLILRPDFDQLDESERREFTRLVSAKWANIRDTWQKSMRKKKNVDNSGSSTKRIRDYVYQEQLMFLQKNLESIPEEPSNKRPRIEPEPENQNEGDARENIEFRVPPTREKKKNFKGLDEKIAEFLDTRINSQKESHHLSFFKGVLPSLETLNIDETLEFQSGVLELIQNIKGKRNYIQRVPHGDPYRQNTEWRDQYDLSQNDTIQKPTLFVTSSQAFIPNSPTTSTSLQSAKSPESDCLDFEEMDSKQSIKLLDE